MTPQETAIRNLLTEWARATREGRHNDVLAHHAADVVIYDVMPPLKYTSAADYRNSWDDWQPDAQGEVRFELEDLVVTASAGVGFAFGILQCGGVMPNGKTFRDTVRITFCLEQRSEGWRVVHQHVSKPLG